MLRDLKRALDRAEGLEPAAFKAVAARLLKDQFLFRERAGDREALRLLGNHFDYFDNLFDALGWSLRRDDDSGVIGILPAEGENHARLKLVDTLMVLCLRLLYEEGFDRFEVRDGCVFTTANTLVERYEVLFDRRPPPRTELRELLGQLRRRGLLELGENDDQGLPGLRILPTIRWVTGPEVIERITAFTEQEVGDAEEEGDPAGETEDDAS